MLFNLFQIFHYRYIYIREKWTFIETSVVLLALFVRKYWAILCFVCYKIFIWFYVVHVNTHMYVNLVIYK